MKIVEEMRLVIHNKERLQKNCYLISQKHIFVTGVSSTKICGYVFAYFYFGETYPELRSVPKEHVLI